MQNLKRFLIFIGILLIFSCSEKSIDPTLGKAIAINGISPAGTWTVSGVGVGAAVRDYTLVFSANSNKVISTVVNTQNNRRTTSEYSVWVLGTETVGGNAYTVLEWRLIKALLQMPISTRTYDYIRINGNNLITTGIEPLDRNAARNAIRNGRTITYTQ